MALQNDGKMVLAGFTYTGTDTYIALARYKGDAQLSISEGQLKPNKMRSYPNPFSISTTI